MDLFVTIFDRNPCFVLKSGRDLVWIEFIDIAGKEYDMFFEQLSVFLSQNGCEWGSIDTITTVTWPGGFTASRVLTLMLSTLHLTDAIKLFAIDRFAYAHMLGASFPLSLQANKAERALALNSGHWSLIAHDECMHPAYHLDDDRDNFFSRENVENFFRSCLLPFGREEFPLKPIYIKKPNITLSAAHRLPISLDTSH
jgi:hypothetical protein